MFPRTEVRAPAAWFRLVLCLFSILPIDAAEVRDLLIVAGQSNAVGYDAKPSGLPEDLIDRQILFWWRCGDPPPDKHDSISGDKWMHLQAQPLGHPIKPRKDRQYGNFGQPEGGFGPEMGMARALAKDKGRKQAVLKAAFSGTGIRRDWDPGSDGDNGSCYRALVSEVKSAIEAAKKKGIEFRLRAFTWVQGESDANQNDVEHYEKALRDMLAALRKDLGAPNLKSLLAVNTRFLEGQNKFMPRIVAAQKSVAAGDPLVAYVDTSKCTIANRVHFDAAGTLEAGRLFAEQLLKLENGDQSGR